MRRLLIATALLLAAPLVMAQAYKWTDANGTVHYSDAPPPQGTKYKKVTTTGTVEPLAGASEGRGSDTTDKSPPSAASAQKPMADTPENRTKLCGTLKSNLDTLKGNGPVVMEQDGQQKLMDAGQRQQQQASTEAQYKQYCSGG
jgi:hypothetical protein